MWVVWVASAMRERRARGVGFGEVLDGVRGDFGEFGVGAGRGAAVSTKAEEDCEGKGGAGEGGGGEGGVEVEVVGPVGEVTGGAADGVEGDAGTTSVGGGVVEAGADARGGGRGTGVGDGRAVEVAAETVHGAEVGHLKDEVFADVRG
ncbi:hypothetical protein HDU96_011013 [Phlyctochytrium bullatum]|nr:hypothetical protein HDU96_011013 [Phlyctochytrium bullatum]